METAETILVIILSSFLAIFLLLSIILLIKCIQLVNRFKGMVQKTDELLDRAGDIGGLLKSLGTSFAFGRVVSRFAHLIRRQAKHSNKRG